MKESNPEFNSSIEVETYLNGCLSIFVSEKTKRSLRILTTKQMYNIFLKNEVILPTSFGSLKSKFQIQDEEVKWSFANLYKVKDDTRLKDFQFRFLHSILNTKYILKKKKLI